ncbi:ABC transporter permease [Mesobacterium pallidum]|uniref:ABC transporter permease n=1 Tax=Mesobacterium pallidum TaxID=2872037 RepID=UPI001EE33777|nr:ABC transporter permease [Mesobacterium pallidum]
MTDTSPNAMHGDIRAVDSARDLAASLPQRSPFREFLKALLVQPSGLIGFLVTLAICLAATFAPWVALWNPLETHYMDALVGPNATYWLGTDELGRDVFSRIIYGARPSLSVAAIAVLSGGSVGIALGVMSGYYRGWLETVLMRLCDIAFAFPLIIIGVCTVIVLGPSNFSVGIAVGIGVAPTFARLARAKVLESMEREYVMAARGMGATDLFIMTRHILPNIAAPLIVQLATAVYGAVIIASALDFLGMGAQPPAPSWGNMLQGGRLYLSQAPIYALAPGVALTVFVVGINLFAAALTNALDPRIRTEILEGRL